MVASQRWSVPGEHSDSFLLPPSCSASAVIALSSSGGYSEASMTVLISQSCVCALSLQSFDAGLKSRQPLPQLGAGGRAYFSISQ